jgi:eukaryotic-like serine/threonine-protein kinase
MAMQGPRWERVQGVFHQAVELPVAERDAFLRTECGEDADLEREVRAMLARDAADSPLLDGGLGEAARVVLSRGQSYPSRIGSYRVLGVLGEGGMGVVFLAEREDLGSRVAIKMLRDALLSPKRRERFLVEQRTLAKLSHPSIARLYDADALPDGTPYFVMELVEGRTLVEHCDAAGAGVRERLRLFRDVCVAVRHAHGQAIIHRDLKPSNILVTPEGNLRLLDFGIARQIDSVDLANDPTRTAFRMFTPAYAAPEQISGGPLGVHTDVYALGVILYELLTGRLPFDVSRLTPGQAERKILETTPDPPSVHGKDHRSGPGRSDWADLDVLCMTAMHRDSHRRYASVDGLIRDLDRFLTGQPLEARPDSVGYRIGKFVRRNRGPVAALVAVAGVLAGLIGFYTSRLADERTAARAEASKAAAVSDYLIGLFEASNPFAGSEADLDVRTLLARGVERVDALDRQPDAQAQMLEVLGRVYTMLSEYGRAEALLTRSLSIRTARAAPAVELASSLGELGNLRRYMAEYDEAESLLREALALRLEHLPPGHPDLGRAYDDLGVVVSNLGRYDEAEELLRRGLEIRRRAYDGPHVLLAHSLNNLGVTLARLGDYQAAEGYLRESIDVASRVYGPDAPGLAPDLANLGVVLEGLGDMAAAEEALVEALRIQRLHLGDQHAETAFRLSQLGGMLRRAGELDRAEGYLREALDIEAATLDPMHRNTGVTRVHLSGVLRERGDLEAAEPLLAEAIEILAASVGPRHEFTATSRCHLAGLREQRGDLPDSEALYRECLTDLVAALPDDHDVLAGFRSRFGALLTRLGRYEEAEPHLVESHRVLLDRLGAGHDHVRHARTRLDELFRVTGRATEARPASVEPAAEDQNR